MTRIATLPLGLMAYRQALAVQETLHARLVAGEAAGFLIFVEHPAVLTLGKHADRQYLKCAASAFEAQGTEIVSIDRGGEVTAHEPGQLVMYPILRLEDFKLTPKTYVRLLEDAVIEALAYFGLNATRDEAYPGVWVEGARKICAIGIRIKQRVSLHGIALNVDNSLELFNKIVPCGIRGREVTSLARELQSGASPSVQAVQQILAQVMLTRLMDRQNVQVLPPDLHWSYDRPIISS